MTTVCEENCFAETLRRLLEQHGKTSAWLVRQTGLSRQTISNLKLGTHQPRLPTLEIIAKAFGVGIGEFVERRFLHHPRKKS